MDYCIHIRACIDVASKGVWGHAPPGNFRRSEIDSGALLGKKNGFLHG